MRFRVPVAEVSALVADVARREIMSRFRRLAGRDVWEKAPGDLVTAADVAAERRLADELGRLVPGSAFIGEEGTGPGDAARDGDRPVWIVDPLDGTANFVRGDERFCVMVALAVGGELLASWLCAPALELSGSALAGIGARVNGRPGAVARNDHPGLRVVVTDPAYQTDEDRAWIGRLTRAGADVRPCSGVGVTYLELATGHHDAAVFGWTTVWDHAAGLLLYKESGGWAATGDGAAFTLAARNTPPLILSGSATAGERLLGIVTAC